MPCNYGMVPAIRFLSGAVGVMMIVVLVAMARGRRKKGTA
jgi:hypothetical protein